MWQQSIWKPHHLLSFLLWGRGFPVPLVLRADAPEKKSFFFYVLVISVSVTIEAFTKICEAGFWKRVTSSPLSLFIFVLLFILSLSLLSLKRWTITSSRPLPCQETGRVRFRCNKLEHTKWGIINTWISISLLLYFYLNIFSPRHCPLSQCHRSSQGGVLLATRTTLLTINDNNDNNDKNENTLF